jgi:hypothetical protein
MEPFDNAFAPLSEPVRSIDKVQNAVPSLGHPSPFS